MLSRQDNYICVNCCYNNLKGEHGVSLCPEVGEENLKSKKGIFFSHYKLNNNKYINGRIE